MPCFKINWPSFIAQRNFFVIINFISNFFTVVFFIIVTWNQSYIIYFGFSQINCSSSISVRNILDGDQYQITFSLIWSILSGCLWSLNSSSILEVPCFKAVSNVIRIFLIVNSWKINSLRSIKSKVEVVLFSFPIDSNKYSIISRR